MKATKRKTAPSRAAKSKTTKSKYTIGIDLSDRACVVCVLDVLGEVVESEKIKLERCELKALARKHPGCQVIIECGTHSPWVSRWLTKHGMDVVVAKPMHRPGGHLYALDLDPTPRRRGGRYDLSFRKNMEPTI